MGTLGVLLVVRRGPVEVTIAAWNMNFWRTPSSRAEAWTYLTEDVRPDVALVQESGPAPDGWNVVGTDIGDGRNWGTRVVSQHPLVEVSAVRPVQVADPVEHRCWRPGTAATAVANIHGRELTVVSLYGLLEPRNAYESVNRHLADLGPLLDSAEHHRQVIIGGDLNLTTQWSGASAGYAPIDRALLDQFRAWGLADLVAESTTSRLDGCPCLEGDACRHVQTYWRDDVPRQNDYLFASTALPRPTSVMIDRAPTDAGLSDHALIVATFSF